MTVSKEMVRLRLYALCLAGDMAGLFCAFLAANYFVLGALWGEPGKPHGLVMFAMVAPLYALLARVLPETAHLLQVIEANRDALLAGDAA